jgi:hypothetical protein
MYKFMTILAIVIVIAGCGDSESGTTNSGSAIIRKPDFVLELGAAPRYDGQTYDQAIYQSYIIKNVGLRVSSDVTLLKIRFQFLYRGVVNSESDMFCSPSLMVGNEYTFMITKAFADTNYDVADWTVRSIIDPGTVFSEESTLNNTRVDQLNHYPGDPGVPDDGLGHHDLYVMNDNINPDPVIYGASTAKFRVFCYAPLVAINGLVKIRMQHYSGNVSQSSYETYVLNQYYDLQYGGISIAYPLAYDAPDTDFLRIEIDIDNVYSEYDETNNVIDVPFVYLPMPNG